MADNLIPITLNVNGERVSLSVTPEETLLESVRNRLKLTGTKKCCGAGECGACTVILNGRSVNSCIILSAETDGAELLTIEGLTKNGRLSILQQAFLDAGAVQCGFCTPGMIMSAHYLLLHKTDPSDEEIREGLSGNLCRCTGYEMIIEAVRIASEDYR